MPNLVNFDKLYKNYSLLMFRKILLLFILSAIILTGKINSQPVVTVSLTGGLTVPLGVLYSRFGDTYNSFAPKTDETYYMTGGFNYGVNFKNGIGKKRMFRFTGELNFSVMSQSKDYDTGTIKLRQSFLSIGFGGEWNLAPRRGWFNPFVGAEIDANFFSGNLQQVLLSTTNTYTMNSTVRFGFALGGGMDIQFHQSVGVLVGIKYFMANVFGKKSENATGTTYGLDDGQHGFAGVSYPARNINVLQIYGGFSYYFGR